MDEALYKKAQSATWKNNSLVVYKCKNDCALPLLPLINREKYPRVFSPFALETDRHVRTLREAGFSVTCDYVVDHCTSGEDFQRVLDNVGPFDFAFMTTPDGATAKTAVMTELIHRDIPFVMYANFDGLPLSNLRYNCLKEYYSALTMLLPPDSPKWLRDDTLENDVLMNRYYLAYKMFDDRFIFVDSQTNLFEVLDNEYN